MYNSKLFEILSLIKGKMIKDLEVFITIPAHGLSDLELEIAHSILKDLGKRRKLEEQKVFDAFFKQTEKAKWNHVKNHLLLVFKQYFSWKLITDHSFKDILLYQFFCKHNLNKNKESLFKNASTNLTRSKDSSSYLYEYLLLEIKGTENRNVRKEDNTLVPMETALDRFYFEKKMRIICETFNRGEIVNSRAENYDDLLNYVNRNKERLNSKKITIYEHLLQLKNKKHRQKSYNRIREILLNSEVSFDAVFEIEVFEQLMNFAIRALNKSKVEYAAHYLAYMDELIRRKHTPNKQRLSHSRFKNAITAALIVGKIKWARTFLDDFNEFLDDKIKLEAVTFNSAHIEFHQGNYEKSWAILSDFKSNDVYYQIAYHKLHLKLRCEEILNNKDDLNSFRAAIASQKKFIRGKQKLSESRKKHFTHALNIIEKIARKKEIDLEKEKGKLSILDIMWVRERQ